MGPAPSGLQEVDGLNHLLESPHPVRYSVPLCTSRPPRRLHYLNCSRSTHVPTDVCPKLFLQMWKGRQHVVRCLPFQPLQQSADRHLRRDRHKQVHVVLCHMALHNLHLVLRADVPDQIAHPRGYLPSQGWSSIFRYPDQVQMDLQYGMRAVSVVRHPSSLNCGARAEAVA